MLSKPCFQIKQVWLQEKQIADKLKSYIDSKHFTNIHKHFTQLFPYKNKEKYYS